jgi:hypothetical protein
MNVALLFVCRDFGKEKKLLLIPPGLGKLIADTVIDRGTHSTSPRAKIIQAFSLYNPKRRREDAGPDSLDERTKPGV